MAGMLTISAAIDIIAPMRNSLSSPPKRLSLNAQLQILSAKKRNHHQGKIEPGFSDFHDDGALLACQISFIA